jgi:D-amino peptidase
MQVYISCDLEGIAGVFDFHQQCSAQGTWYKQARRLCTLELNAAVEGAIEGGATEVYAWDGHDSFPGCIEYELLHPACQLIVGAGSGAPAGMDETFDALIQIGQHARKGTPGGILAHGGWELNETEIGEIGMTALIAGLYGIPCIMVSGDRAAAEETQKILPYTETAVVKEALLPKIYDLETAPQIALSPEKARDLIKFKAQAAMKKIKRISPFTISPPYTLKMFFTDERQTENVLKKYPQALKVNHLQLIFKSDELTKLPITELSP